MTPADLLASAMLVSLVTYSLLAGADYGAGFWDLMCSGPRRDQQRRLIEKAIAPVWEANHVWLILLIVLLFSGFPDAFGALCVGLAIPLFLLLLGIVLRGCSFVFRAYFTGEKQIQLYWGKVFSISSSMTPLFLGILIGAISCDSVIMNRGVSENGFVKTWFLPFPIAVGVLALSLFVYLSACYLAVEAGNTELEDDFRIRALISGIVSISMAGAAYVLAGTSAIREGLSTRPIAWLVEICGLGAALVSFRGLYLRRFREVRVAAAIQVALIVAGWGIAQYPYLIRPRITINNSAAPANVVSAINVALGCGAIVLIPSLILLFIIFNKVRSARQLAQENN